MLFNARKFTNQIGRALGIGCICPGYVDVSEYCKRVITHDREMIRDYNSGKLIESNSTRR